MLPFSRLCMLNAHPSLPRCGRASQSGLLLPLLQLPRNPCPQSHTRNDHRCPFLEIFPGERRVAITPQNVALLLKKGVSRVLVQRGAGESAQLLDDAYVKAGATLVDRDAIWSQSDIVLKVRSPQSEGPFNEIQALRQGSTVISFLYPYRTNLSLKRSQLAA